MEQIIKLAIYIHAFFGGIGLLCGFGIMIAKKGTLLHQRLGKYFSYGMVISSAISLPICWLPNHGNIFLFLIGLFTIYLVLTGNRALTFKSKNKLKPALLDYLISITMVISSLLMIVIGIIGQLQNNKNSILFLIFGIVGFYISIRDFRFYKNYKTQKQLWLKAHIGKMMGAFIASVTAFVVAALGLGSLVSWILPSVFGAMVIVYWNRKIKSNSPSPFL